MFDFYGNASGKGELKAGNVLGSLTLDTEAELVDDIIYFDDIEKIITAFKRVYSGMNHERIQYPA